jgi:hypothetical protein
MRDPSGEAVSVKEGSGREPEREGHAEVRDERTRHRVVPLSRAFMK